MLYFFLKRVKKQLYPIQPINFCSEFSSALLVPFAVLGTKKGVRYGSLFWYHSQLLTVETEIIVYRSVLYRTVPLSGNEPWYVPLRYQNGLFMYKHVPFEQWQFLYLYFWECTFACFNMLLECLSTFLACLTTFNMFKALPLCFNTLLMCFSMILVVAILKKKKKTMHIAKFEPFSSYFYTMHYC